MEQVLDISWKSIVKVLITGFALYILFLMRDMVVWFFFALVISLLFEPAIGFLQKLRIPRVVAVIAVYTSLLAIIGLMIYLIAPAFVLEINQLARNTPEYLEKLHPLLRTVGINTAKDFGETTSDLATIIQDSSQSIFRAAAFFFGGIASTMFIFVFAFYLSLEEGGFEKFLRLLAPRKYESYAMDIFRKAQFKVSGWFISRILACIFVGIASFIVFILLDVRYSFMLAFVSGILTFIPFIGPLITSLLALAFIGVSQSWFVAFYVVVALTIIQEVENKIVSPILMKKFMDLPPVLVLVSLVIGGTLFGFLGMLFFMPVFGIIYEFLKEFFEERKAKQLY